MKWLLLLLLAGCATPMPPPDTGDLDWAKQHWMKALGRETWGFPLVIQPGQLPVEDDALAYPLIGKGAFITYRTGHDQERRRSVFVHELGHALRVHHNPDQRSAMYSDAPSTNLLPDDLAQARRFIQTPWPLGGLLF